MRTSPEKRAHPRKDYSKQSTVARRDRIPPVLTRPRCEPNALGQIQVLKGSVNCCTGGMIYTGLERSARPCPPMLTRWSSWVSSGLHSFRMIYAGLEGGLATCAAQRASSLAAAPCSAIKPSRPRLVSARPKVCTWHDREPLHFPQNGV